MDSKLISVILYGFVGAALALVTTYFFIYNDEVYENTRFVESFKHPMLAAKDDPKKLQAMQSLKSKGLEWATYQLHDAIKDNEYDIAKLYIDAGMKLVDKGLIVGQMIENPGGWFELLKILGVDNKQDLSGLFHVPRYLSALDEYFKLVERRYEAPHTMAFKNHYIEYRKIEQLWIDEKDAEIAKVDEMCDGNTRCIAVNVPAIQIEYDKKRPVPPKKDLIIWQKPYVSLMSAALLLGHQDIIDYLEQKGVTSRLNKIEMSDLGMVVFEVSKKGVISYPEGITVNKPKRGKRRAGPQTG
jgi:hypothetical protein